MFFFKLLNVACLFCITTCYCVACGQDEVLDAATEIARSGKWGDELQRIEYRAMYFQDGVPAESQDVIEYNGEFGKRTTQRVDKASSGVEDVTIANPDYAFQLKRTALGEPWLLAGFELRSNERVSTGPRAILVSAWQHIRSIPSVAGGRTPWPDWIESFQVSVSDIGQNQIKVNGVRQEAGVGPLGFINEYQMVIDKQTGSVHSYALSESGTEKITGKIIFDENGEAFEWQETAVSPGVLDPIKTSVQIHSISRNMVSEKSEFYLSHYGFPEPNLGSSGMSTAVLLAFGCRSIICGGVYYRFCRRNAA